MRFKFKKGYNYLVILVIVLSWVFTYGDQYYNIKYTIDGDTILLNNNNLVRYIGIDCPEIDHKKGKAEYFGFEAKEANKTLVSAATIRFEYDVEKKDHYGRRILAYVYTSDGTFVNNELIKLGYAWVLIKKPNTKHYYDFLFSQRQAMIRKLGIWKDWKEKDGINYIGNTKSRRFHDTNCPFGLRTSTTNRVLFQKKWDAFYAGYAPCKKCIKKGE